MRYIVSLLFSIFIISTAFAGDFGVVSGGTADWTLTAGGTDTNSIKEIFFDAASMQPLESNFAVLESTVSEGGTIRGFARAFDDTTREYANFKWSVPTDIDTSATVTFRAYVMARTAASANVQLDFDHACVNDGEAFEATYTEESSGDFALDTNQDDVTEKTWTETVTNLGWAANDMCFGRISRDPAAASDLTGDMLLFQLVIEVPRS